MNLHFEPVPWSLNTNLYEVNLRQYTKEGTFRAFAAELPRLSDMGVKVLWFMPITPISKEKRLGTLGSYYACSNYTDVNPEFGTLHDFRQLVKRAHELGMKVIIDWVANHTGWDHVWTRTNPGFYNRNAHGEFYDKNGWEDVIDLNFYDHSMRRAMIACMEFWVKECDIDGFRCDMAHLVPLDFWRNARIHLDKVKPLFWLGETEHPSYQPVFDCSYAWHWMHLTESFVKGKVGIDELRLALIEYERKKLPHTNYLFFTSNHDENSWNGTEYEKYNNAALPLAVFACMWNGLPLIYSGQEMPNHKRLKFFDKDEIQWTGKNELHDFYKTLLTLRSTFDGERTETQLMHTLGDRNVLAFEKTSSTKQILVILNLSSEQQWINIAEAVAKGNYRNVFTQKEEAPSLKDLMMEPWSYLVLEKI